METNLKTKFDGRNMRVDPIQDKAINFLTKILGYKLNHGSRVEFVLVGFLHTTCVMVIKKEKLHCYSATIRQYCKDKENKECSI